MQAPPPDQGLTQGQRAIVCAALTLLFLPLLLDLLAFGWNWASRGQLEPLYDMLFMYLFLLILLVPAAASALLVFARHGFQRGLVDPFTYALAGAAGTGALLVLIDVAEHYFTPGLRWEPAAIGLGLGAVFGVCFRGLAALIPWRTSLPDPSSP